MSVLAVWVACLVRSTLCPVILLAAAHAALRVLAGTFDVAKAMALRALLGSVDVRQDLVSVVSDIHMFWCHGSLEDYLDNLRGANSSSFNHRYRYEESIVDITGGHISWEPLDDSYGCVQTARLICANVYSEKSGHIRISSGRFRLVPHSQNTRKA